MCYLDADVVHRKTGHSEVKTKFRLRAYRFPAAERSRGHSGSRSGWSSTKHYLEPSATSVHRVYHVGKIIVLVQTFVRISQVEYQTISCM